MLSKSRSQAAASPPRSSAAAGRTYIKRIPAEISCLGSWPIGSWRLRDTFFMSGWGADPDVSDRSAASGDDGRNLRFLHPLEFPSVTPEGGGCGRCRDYGAGRAAPEMVSAREGGAAGGGGSRRWQSDGRRPASRDFGEPALQLACRLEGRGGDHAGAAGAVVHSTGGDWRVESSGSSDVDPIGTAGATATWARW